MKAELLKYEPDIIAHKIYEEIEHILNEIAKTGEYRIELVQGIINAVRAARSAHREIISSDTPKHNKYNLQVFSIVFQHNYFIFFHDSKILRRKTLCTGRRHLELTKYLPHFPLAPDTSLCMI